MYAFFLNVLLALIWTLAVGRFTFHQLVLGFLLGFVVVTILEPLWGTNVYRRRLWRGLAFVAFFAWEILLSSLRIAYDVVTPRLRAQPRIVAYPLRARTDTEITLFANVLALTPGTLPLDVSTDRRVLYVHVMYAQDKEAVLQELERSLERRLLEVLR
ncbi:MAG: Na+/H+ antiporter subunit E [Thermomicrobium sp.]|nr:Na+/H+ antiporter subunit E [Thermomicrobium sp.]MDW8059061.1 Na+/H+ antiporter subunit E [Thermomicrobium sp.]